MAKTVHNSFENQLTNAADMVKTLCSSTKQQPNGLLDLSDMNIWINNSDGDGEDMEVSTIGFNNDVFGVYVGYDDFFPFDELSDDEIEMIYDNVINDNF